MKKPCDTCPTNIKQAIENGEITCYLTCKDFKKWQVKELVAYLERAAGIT